MRTTIPKNRTAPLVLFAILSILVSLILGLYHMNRMARYSIETKLNTYDSLTDNVMTLLKQELENNYQEIQVSANLVAKTGELTKENITTLLPLLSEEQSYIDVAIVDNQGKGYNLAGEELDLADEPYYNIALQGQVNASNEIMYDKEGIPFIVFAAPIIDNGDYKGVLLAKVNAQISNIPILNGDSETNDIIYLINEDKKLVSYVQGSDIKDFDYQRLISSGTFLENYQVSMDSMNLSEFFVKDNSPKETYIWDERPIGINNWSILIGRVNVLNPITRDILRLTNMMWIFITVSTFLLFTVMIITQRRSNRKVIRMLYLDPVTGGDNWYKFRINVSKILSSKLYTKKKYALVNFDINRFKIINDAYGYQKGDEVLKDIYDVVQEWAKPGEPFTRYAADQFYILLHYMDEQEITERINDLSDRLHQLRYTKTARIFYGVYFISERQDSVDRMGEFAGIAKNNIKGNTEGAISFFDEIARGRLLEEEEIEKSMNEALKNDEFQVYLQPKYTVRDETVSGAEALVRWYNSNGNLISPGYFIPVFEKNGFITELDFYMLNKVCQLLRSWLDNGFHPLPISVNISRLHFVNPHLADTIKEIVDKYNVPHNLIELELTESAFLQNKQILIKTVVMLRKYGFLVSMDDFGAGYSSLNSLKDLPLDVVKLDGELFRLTGEVERGLTVIRNTISMAKDLHMKVVAECIETKEQVEFLYTVGCDIIQGYYYAKPMPVDQFEKRYISIKNIDYVDGK